MRRIALTTAAMLSLLLCIAVCTLCVRSYRMSERVDWRTDRGWRSVQTLRGHLTVHLFVADVLAQPRHVHGPEYARDDARDPVNWLLFMGGSLGDRLSSYEWAGFAWHERHNRAAGTLHAIACVPFWFLAAITAPLPAWWLAGPLRAAVRHRRRQRRGLCRHCGYDLRGNTSSACPECGGVATGATDSAAAKAARSSA